MYVSIIAEDFYWHYTTYYYRRVTPKVDVRIVIAVTITIISVCQYYVAWTNYKAALGYLVQVPKYRSRAKDIAVRDKLLETDKKKLRGKSKVNTGPVYLMLNTHLEFHINKQHTGKNNPLTSAAVISFLFSVILQQTAKVDTYNC